ncbi:LSP1 protein, partial [Todus mexicanus]|nr:LSP1 protein [Todus mexicanus]
RSPRQSYQEEDSGVREAEVKMEQIQLDQESPEETREEDVVIREEERLCQDEEPDQQREEEESPKEEEKKRRRDEDNDETPDKRKKAPSPTNLEEEGEEEQCSDNTAVCSMKITDRTESLKRSIKKSNSLKKSQPPLPVSKIDDRLEQYTQAIETSTKAPKPVRQPSLDLPTTSMMVASTKSLWETGEVAAQSAVKSQPCKDIVAGDIVSKRSLWEQKHNPKPETSVKPAPGKKYKFVATGHGQYKKVLIDDAAEQ